LCVNSTGNSFDARGRVELPEHAAPTQQLLIDQMLAMHDQMRVLQHQIQDQTHALQDRIDTLRDRIG
jgi:hypothetical protein